MNQVVKEKLKSRLRSLAWRAGGMLVVMGLNFIVTNVGLLDLSPLIVTLVGLMVGEVTKFIKINLPEIWKAQASQ